jgi:hypothetical protein
VAGGDLPHTSTHELRLMIGDGAHDNEEEDDEDETVTSMLPVQIVGTHLDLHTGMLAVLPKTSGGATTIDRL